MFLYQDLFQQKMISEDDSYGILNKIAERLNIKKKYELFNENIFYLYVVCSCI